jgi:hypothetical protein
MRFQCAKKNSKLYEKTCRGLRDIKALLWPGDVSINESKQLRSNKIVLHLEHHRLLHKAVVLGGMTETVLNLHTFCDFNHPRLSRVYYWRRVRR